MSLAFLIIKAVIQVYTWVTWPLYYLFSDRRLLRTNVHKVAFEIGRTKRHVTFKAVDRPCPMQDEVKKAGVDTMDKLSRFVTLKYKDRSALGTREIVKEEKDDKGMTKRIMGEYKWQPYTEYSSNASWFGKGLRELGVEPKDKVCIFADTRAEWLISATGCWRNSIALCTIYTNLGRDGIIHGINETEVSTVITSTDLLPKLVEVLSELPSVKNVIYFSNPVKPDPEPMTEIQIHSFQSVIERGQFSTLTESAPSPSDTAIIMYTSGSTGVPKGVILSHGNMISGVMSIMTTPIRTMDKIRPICEKDSYIAFLPLAHVLEMLAEHVMLLMGVKVGYSSPYTLTDKSTMIRPGDKGDAVVLKPTIMAAVPLILDRIYKGIKNNINTKSPFARLLVNYLFEYKKHWLKKGMDSPIANALVFSKMKSLVGGEILVVLSGGAALSEDAHEYIRAALSCVLLQGYGLTETCSTATITEADDPRTGLVGPPLPGVEMRIESWEEGGYTINDDCGPRGEIVIGGDHISQGYYNMPEKTAGDFYEDDGVRFFRTGDIGHVQPDGNIKIIDRKKDLVKLQHGEYVALGKVEARLKIHPIVDNICVCADSLHNNTVALIVPEENKVKELALELGKKYGTKEDLCKDNALTKAVLDDLMRHGLQSHLQKFEIPKEIQLIPEIWTPESGLVTAAFKLRRKPIQEKYKTELERLYARLTGTDAVVIDLEGKKPAVLNIGNSRVVPA